ncbi:metal-dependent hydrolase [Pseudoalteromonas sp. T1lg48]|uniref:metal-dependent hydrolase n=1 Tax=Pseudoalteromonas sp. T1lg48 TaxID=2077100 RepID=UPI001319BC44|nr:metal-dependent hydrolase [Pseudoalteromonas sp. T1lg48]
MDPLTHVLIGALVAQLPAAKPLSEDAGADTCTKTDWKLRAAIGAAVALFPDIDYLLFWLNPLDFLAYWHRAETHSLLLSPVWAALISYLLCKLLRLANAALVFTICWLAILSHLVADTLTVYGTRWFAPLSDMQFSWDLLFIVDPYFTLSVMLAGLLFYICRKKTCHQKRYHLAALSPPLLYLAAVLGIKLTLMAQIQQQTPAPAASSRLLPQPFSPLYWQLLSEDEEHIYQAYIKFKTDPLADNLSHAAGVTGFSGAYTRTDALQWHSYTHPAHAEPLVQQAWQQPKFKAFRDFAQYPVVLAKETSAKQSCVWFSDLRYHWPGIQPYFRYAMCQSLDGQWRLKRGRYFSGQSQELD